eukprot:1157658-Pelagomonas_calceolata.AAC.7
MVCTKRGGAPHWAPPAHSKQPHKEGDGASKKRGGGGLEIKASCSSKVDGVPEGCAPHWAPSAHSKQPHNIGWCACPIW